MVKCQEMVMEEKSQQLKSERSQAKVDPSQKSEPQIYSAYNNLTQSYVFVSHKSILDP